MKLKLFLLSIIALLSLVAYQKYSEYSALKSIDSYESCISAKGSEIKESYPTRCVTRFGAHFIEPTQYTLNPNNDIPTQFEPGIFSDGLYTNKSAGFAFSLPERSTPITANEGVIALTNNLQIAFTGYPFEIYEGAIQSAKDNIENPQIKQLNGGVLYVGKQTPGAGGGVMTRYAIFNTQPYPTVITLLYENSTEIANFNQIISTFQIY